jgi:DNA-binding transcriptional regulator YiaG
VQNTVVMAMHGEELKAIRKQLGMNQVEFGEALGLTSKFIGMMERGVAVIEKRTGLAALYLQHIGAASGPEPGIAVPTSAA